ncbi:HupE/UreJ family protein [Ferrovibrio sp.]|uniref:HupE/UreJ family protein n=1 Tax=Ferrovibrio sp. TaxID=1917215 RepID=UPI003D27B0B0
MRIKTAFLITAMTLATSAAQAHHPMGGMTPRSLMEGLLSGLGHPILGLDHFAAFIGFGLVLALSGLPVVVAVLLPACLAMGAVLHVSGVALPHAETLILLSLVAMAVSLLAIRKLGRLLPTLVILVSAALHGYVLAETIIGAEPTPLLAYFAGLVIIQSAMLLGLVLLLRLPVLIAASVPVSRAAAIALLLVGGLSLVL